MMYRSMQAKEDQKINSYPLKMMGIACVCIVIAVIAFSVFKSSFHSSISETGVSQAKRANTVRSKPVVIEYKDNDVVPVGSVYAAAPPPSLPSSAAPPPSLPSSAASRVPVFNEDFPVVRSSKVLPDEITAGYKETRMVGKVVMFQQGLDGAPDKEIVIYESR